MSLLTRSLLACLPLAAAAAACSDSSSAPAGPHLAIVTRSGAPLSALAGDGVPLKVVEQAEDGSIEGLPAGASVNWTAPDVVTTLAPGDTTDSSPLPTPGQDPTAAWIQNPSRPDRAADLGGVLFVLDPGTDQNATVQVSATVSSAGVSSDVTALIPVDPAPAGDWTRGAALYGSGGANCAECHGDTGAGSPADPDGSTYTFAGGTYDFPAPGINAEPGNAAGDPAWDAALFAVAARADMDNGGVALRSPMPDWLSQANPATGQPLTTQDLADIFAFLKTQTH